MKPLRFEPMTFSLETKVQNIVNCDSLPIETKHLTYESNLAVKDKKEKNREVTMPLPRGYFFFAGAFFASFLTGFFAIKMTSGFNI